MNIHDFLLMAGGRCPEESVIAYLCQSTEGLYKQPEVRRRAEKFIDGLIEKGHLRRYYVGSTFSVLELPECPEPTWHSP